MRKRVWVAAAAVLAAGCGSAPGAGGDSAAAGAGASADSGSACRIVRRDVLLDAAVRETSGAAFAPGETEAVWTHNDSGNDAVLFSIGVDGRIRERLEVDGARNRDWEDMAVGPCPAGRCLYLFDTGDGGGRGRRDPVQLYRVPLPAPGAERTDPAERFEATFPRRLRDTEAGFVLPDGSVYVINKGNRDPVELWRWPTPLEAGPVELVPVRVLAPRPEQPGDRVTAADASPDGRWVAVRTYGRLALYRTAELLGSGGPAFTMELASLGEPQGEAVALADDGTVVLTTESGSGAFPPRATWLKCELPAG